MMSVDTTQSTASDRIKFFINGVHQTTLDNSTYPSQNYEFYINSNKTHYIGEEAVRHRYPYSGLLADFYFIDGTALSTPVGNLIQDTGYSSYKPKAFDMSSYSGNSVHLLFENTSAIGEDDAGSNDFTATNLSSHDVMLDTPTKNYATLNPLQKAGTGGDDPTEGNLSLTGGSNPSKAFSSTVCANSGKYYAEFHLDALGYPTVAVGDTSLWVDGYGSGRIQGNGVVAYDIRAASTNGQYFINSTSSSSNVGITPATDDIIQVAFDADTRKVWFGRNGTWNGSGNPANGTNHVGVVNGTDALAVLLRSEVHSSAGTTVANYGQDPTFVGGASSRSDSPDTSQSEFYFAPPTGFKSLNTSNLDAPSVTPSEHFNSLVYQGASPSDKAVTGVGFQPDLVWIKARTQSYSHAIYDSVRGATKELHSDTTEAEDTDSNGLKTFDSDGFTVGSDVEVGDPTGTRISWNWKAHQTQPTPTIYSTTLTLLVRDDNNDGTGWGNTKFEVFEGSASLGTISCPTTYDSSSGNYQETWRIKTNNASKIKVVWKDVDTSSLYGANRLWYVYALFENGSTQEAIWDPNNTGWDGSNPTPSNGDVFRAQTSSANEATTGLLVRSDLDPDANSEKYNAAAGVTMFTYTGNSSTNNDTMLFNHSLGVPIDFAIGKCRDTASDQGGNWVVWHKDLSNEYSQLYLNQSEQENESSSNTSAWFTTETAGSQHQAKIRNVEIYDYDGNTDTVRMVDNSKDFVFYGFAGVESYSKIGSYTGTGSATSPPFIYTGFEVGWLLTKNIDNNNVHWNVHDAARNPHNVVDERVWPNLPNASDSNYDKFDFYSNGFRPVTGDSGHNGNGNTIIYVAFSSSSPFKYANAR
jgi:hypothetical protein